MTIIVVDIDAVECFRTSTITGGGGADDVLALLGGLLSTVVDVVVAVVVSDLLAVVTVVGSCCCFAAVVNAAAFAAAICCSMVRGGRFGTMRSGSGAIGALPWNAGEVDDDESMELSSFLSPPLPVDPTSVTALRFEGDMGDVGMSVSELPDVDTDELPGTPRKPSS